MPRRHRREPVGPRFAGPGGITKPCPWPGCPRRIPLSQVLCPDDWRRLPARLQAAWNQARTEDSAAAIDEALAAIVAYARRSAA
jgi:hypothetical protein